jgi:ABC-type multidrug transport system fused ATPase/permease subunit
MDNLDSFLKLLEENRILAGYLIVGGLFLILLIFLLVKSFSARKQPALAGSAMPISQPRMSAMPSAEQVTTSRFTAEQPDTRIFLDQLRKVADESQKVIYKLDTEIAEKERIIIEKTQYMQSLEQRISEMPVEQILNQQSEKLRKETEKKLAQLKQDASTKSYQMWFLGFLVGLVIMACIAVAYYLLVLKAG